MLPDVPVEVPQSAEAASQAAATIVLPARLPAHCFLTAANDYALPAKVLVAIVKHESRGRSVVRRNTNGTFDYGVTQINSASWGKYMQERYGIPPEVPV